MDLKKYRAYIAAFAIVVFLLLLKGALSYTNTVEFCTSCHSMKFPYEEYKKSMHFKSPSGVTAGCPDCHVPHQIIPLIKAKVMAAKDVWAEITHPSMTEDEWAKMRPELAKRVREKLLKSDSATCRRCHNFENLVPSRDRGVNAHEKAKEKGKTCIECHYNLVHAEVPWEKGIKDGGAGQAEEEEL